MSFAPIHHDSAETKIRAYLPGMFFISISPFLLGLFLLSDHLDICPAAQKVVSEAEDFRNCF